MKEENTKYFKYVLFLFNISYITYKFLAYAKKTQIFILNPKAHKIKLAQILNTAYNFLLLQFKYFTEQKKKRPYAMKFFLQIKT